MSASGGALEALPPPAAAGRVPDAARQAFRRANRAARPALVAVAVLFWLWFMLPQALGGRAGWVLVDGKSMLPRYKTGDLVLVERQSHYRVGEVIAYRVPKGDPMAGSQVIHRIVGGDGTRGFVVKGDNRTAPDVWHPRDGDVVGAKLSRGGDSELTFAIREAGWKLAFDPALRLQHFLPAKCRDWRQGYQAC